MIILKYAGLIIGSLAGCYILYMFIIAVVPGVTARDQDLDEEDNSGNENIRTLPDTDALRKDISFQVKETIIKGWLYLPQEKIAPYPCIILAHGLGVTMDFGLDRYAGRFMKSGFAALVFDYRHLGKSGGEPRQLVWIPKQLEDWAAAIDYAKSLKEINASKIGLWGTSLSGGHVVEMASRRHDMACISAQCPLLDGMAGGWDTINTYGLKNILKLGMVHGVRDLVRSWLGLSPHVIPLAGRTGTVAVMPDDQAFNFFKAAAPIDFVNRVCARIFIRMDKYHPIHHAARIQCPVLIQVCEKDLAAPPGLVETLPCVFQGKGLIIKNPIDHFDIYTGDHFEKSVNEQVSFFRQHLM